MLIIKTIIIVMVDHVLSQSDALGKIKILKGLVVRYIDQVFFGVVGPEVRREGNVCYE